MKDLDTVLRVSVNELGVLSEMPWTGNALVFCVSYWPRAERIREKKSIGQRIKPFFAEGGESRADAFLVKVASIGPGSTKIIDAYTRIFSPYSTVGKNSSYCWLS